MMGNEDGTEFRVKLLNSIWFRVSEFSLFRNVSILISLKGNGSTLFVSCGSRGGILDGLLIGAI